MCTIELLRRRGRATKHLAPQVGLEPTTPRLTAGCSAIELLRNNREAQSGLLAPRPCFRAKRAALERQSLGSMGFDPAGVNPAQGALGAACSNKMRSASGIVTPPNARNRLWNSPSEYAVPMRFFISSRSLRIRHLPHV